MTERRLRLLLSLLHQLIDEQKELDKKTVELTAASATVSHALALAQKSMLDNAYAGVTGKLSLPAPAPSAPVAPLSPDAAALAQYEALKAKGSNFAANAYMRLNAQAIQRARASRAS